MRRTIVPPSMLAVIFTVGLALCPALLGFAPRDADPDLMYQPIKSELARALRAGSIPFWSHRFGLGVPLVAESHVAAFYPPNWLLYSIWEVGTAYRLTLWLHFVALGATTYAYARTVGIGSAGSAIAAASFALCGFQAAHTVHEPFYHVLPYLPLCLLLADHYVATGRAAWLAALALAWGAQITLGHFQVQMWTAALVLLTGTWRTLAGGNRSARKLFRSLGLVIGLGWGLAIAWVQVRLTWELTGFAGFVRPPHLLANYSLPPTHLAQFALPEVFLARTDGNAYWGRSGTSPVEACAYIGVLPLVLAFIGLLAAPRDRALGPWRLLVLLTLVLATMPGWWPDGFLALLQLPGLGWFRAPARYTLLTSLGLALLAGRGLDHAVTRQRFWTGLTLAIAVGAAAWTWSLHWSGQAQVQSALRAGTIPVRFVGAGLAWGLSLAAVVGWRLGRLGSWVPFVVTALELGSLFYIGPARWSWTVRLPQESPVLQRLAALPDAGLIAGRLLNLPVVAGRTTAFPSLGIAPPPPTYLLESATLPPAQNSEFQRRWNRRLGITHGVWGSRDDVSGTELVAEITDPVVDQLMANNPALNNGGLGPWKLVRTRNVFPAAWIGRRIREVPDWGQLYTELSRADTIDEAWFLSEDLPSPLSQPLARTASIKSWDGRTAVVEHDAACILILRQAAYPGWVYQTNGWPERPVLKVDGGLQGVLLAGSGTSRVHLSYRPTGLRTATAITLAAVAAAIAVCSMAVWKVSGAR